MAAITLGQDGQEGDNVFSLWLHLVLGESVAIDGRQTVLLSVLSSIYGCLRAPSSVHACLSQNMKLLPGLSLQCCGRHSGMQMWSPSLYSYFIFNWVSSFYTVISLCRYLCLKEMCLSRITITILLTVSVFRVWFSQRDYLFVPLHRTGTSRNICWGKWPIFFGCLCFLELGGGELESISSKSFYDSMTHA